jgi:TolB-like protein/Tfp pilus assembly protein PilF
MKLADISHTRWRELEPLVDAALELDPLRRAAFAESACGRDAVLGAELKALLLACEQGESMFTQPALVALAPLLEDTDTPVPGYLGAYRIIREIGRGGMATVYLAEDAKHGRDVAVKVLHANLSRFIGRDRFIREIEIAAGLSHPHILPLHDSGEAYGDPSELNRGTSILYFVSPFIDGCSLRDLLEREKRLSAADTVRLGREIALALDYAHRRGVVHLDIKPGNVLLQDGHAVITDFGIAQAMSSVGEARHDRSGALMLVGTPAYMSPEQAVAAGPLDGRSDIYSLGCVLHEMLTGTRPVDGAADFSSVDISPHLAAVIARAIARKPEDRFQTAADLAHALSESVWTAERRAFSRRWLAAVLIAATVAVAAVVVGVMRGRPGADSAVAGPVFARSVAVLPFENTSSDTSQNYFATGFAQELIAKLARSSDLRVTPARSAFQFRAGTNLQTVARQLRVAFVLRGVAREWSDSAYVRVELLRTSDGGIVWTGIYQRPTRDLFAIQDDIADHAARALNTTLLADALTAGAGPRNLASYNLVLRGRYYLAQPTLDNVNHALGLFAQAVSVDSSNAAAYVGLARAYRVEAGEGWIPVDSGSTLSREAARRAIALDPRLAGGYEALAYIQTAYDWDWGAAEANYRKALELEPGNADVLRSVALLFARLGRFDEAAVGLRKAVDRDPVAATYSNLSYVLGASGHWRESESAARTALALGPTSILRHFNLARALLFEGRTTAALDELRAEVGENWRLMGQSLALYAAGRRTESNRALAEFEAKYANHSAMQIADVHAYRGNRDAAFAWLERAYAQRDPGIADLKSDPWLSSLRGDPRYIEWLKRLRLPLAQ